MSRNASLIGHGVLGWMICGSTIAIGRQFLSMASTLIVHAIVAPVAFALLAAHFFHGYPDAGPLRVSLTLVGVVIGLDGVVVAPLVERSYVMFTSPFGTWIPFASIWLASFLVGRTWRERREAQI